ncbi:fungal-specific transcription factor domain-containing protein [Ilyonectria destructans]|nr:fungal-specific transcription factor domain-containing protein [Ilyonectria destructans]
MTTPAKLSKSCIPCRDRKIKCDAPLRGLPCSSCSRKEWQGDCTLPTRKRRETNRIQKADHKRPRTPQCPPKIRPGSPRESEASVSASIIVCNNSQTERSSESTIVRKTNSRIKQLDHCRDPTKYQTSIHYLNILAQVEGDGKYKSQESDNLTKDNNAGPISAYVFNNRFGHSSVAARQVDPVDYAFLLGKGVFDLPPQHCMQAILQAYFEFVYPFAPILDPVAFLRSFLSDSYSLFLMYAILASGILHVSSSAISECGFESRSEAQASFCSKATLIHDFQYETSRIHMLQGSLILGAVVSTRAMDKDFHYWFYNSVRLITRTDHHRNLSDTANGKDANFSKLYRRMWWTLYCRDVLLSFVGIQRIGLLSQLDCTIIPLTEQDWEVEDIPENLKSLLKPITSRQRLAFISYCDLAVTGSQCLRAAADNHEQDPKCVIEPLGTWRSSLREVLQRHDQSLQFDMAYSFLLASSYRFECILLRLMCPRWQSQDLTRREWTKRRLRLAVFELDTIHMAEIPPIQQILPIFERVLARHNLTPCTTDALNSNAPQRNPEPTTNKGVHDAPWRAGFFATGWQDLPDFDDFSFDDFTGFEFVDN